MIANDTTDVSFCETNVSAFWDVLCEQDTSFRAASGITRCLKIGTSNISEGVLKELSFTTGQIISYSQALQAGLSQANRLSSTN